MSRAVRIDRKTIDDRSDAYVVAEIGHNHQGSVERAAQLVCAAHRAGASAVKLQKRDNRALYTEEYYNSPYLGRHSFGPTYGAHREALELGRADYESLIELSRSLGITFFSTAFDFASADLLAELGVPAFKLASGDLRNTPLIRHVARFDRPMILSSGAATLDDVRRAYAAAREWNEQVCLLQCTARYPAPIEELDLNVITTFRSEFPNAVVGLSIHSQSLAASIAAYALGARVIETHFTFDCDAVGTDHSFSLDPARMEALVNALGQTRDALGSREKRIHSGEAPALRKMGKMLVAARDLPPGHRIGFGSVAIKSPGNGLAPFELDRLVGRTLCRSLKHDEPFELSSLVEDACDAQEG